MERWKWWSNLFRCLAHKHTKNFNHLSESDLEKLIDKYEQQ